jgi:hypothetical protein
VRPTWLRDLVIDMLYARARVVIVGTHARGARNEWTRPCWRFLRWAKAHQRPLTDDLTSCLRGYYEGRS